MAELEFHRVSHAYRRGAPVLNDLSLMVGPGITGLVGANGAGKSTLMRMAAGALPPGAGAVTVDGDDVYRRGDRQRALSRVAWMPQNPSAPKSVRVLDFVAYLAWLRGSSWSEASRKASGALESVRLGAYSRQRVGSLSGGMVRRLWLAQAIAGEPPVLLLDEPSVGLDPRQRATMVELLRQVSGTTVILSSHLLEDVVELADRVVVLDEGAVLHDGPPPSDGDPDWLLSHIPDHEE